MILNVKKNSLVYKFFLITLYRTKNRGRAAKSRFEYTQVDNVYKLRVIGFLHTLIGLTLKYEEE